NGDGATDGADLGLLLGSWGPCHGASCSTDFNGDGVTDGADLGTLVASWGLCPASSDVINPGDDTLSDIETIDAGFDAASGGCCETFPEYATGLKAGRVNGGLAGVCALQGPCDDPADRNASIPTPATPIKTYRLSIHVFCENNGSNCAATQADVDAAVARLNN